MSEWEDKTALVYDHGIFLPFAQTLGKEGGFGEVLYYTAGDRYALKSADVMRGERMPGIRRVDSFWDHLDSADIVVFPFLGDGDLQEHLRGMGHRVWGNGRADLLELDRAGFRKLLNGMDMPTADSDLIEGLPALEEYMRDPANDDRFLKTSFFRGDMETFHHQSWKLSEQRLRELQLRLGPYGNEIRILAEPRIDGCEPGWDSYAVDGEFPKFPVWGFELKNAAYCGTYLDMPESLASLAAAMSQPLRSFGARGSFHFEARITEDGAAYLTDPTIRLASPAGESLCLLIENWAEIVWHGAAGTLVEPDYAAPWVGQIVLKSPWSADNYLSVWVPEKYRENVFFHAAMGYDDVTAVMPGGDEIFGSAVAIGETREEAMNAAMEIAESIEAYQLDFDKNAPRDMKKCYEEATL